MPSKLPLASTPRPRAPLLRPLALAAFVLAALLASGADAAITGVCPDGSMFIVKHEKSIPCKAAKVVEPEEMPPIRPEYLPQPYTWKVYNEAQDPNNPYNLIDAAREVRELRENGPQLQGRPQARPQYGGAGGAPPVSAPGPAPTPAPTRQAAPLDLGLSDDEIRDLYYVVELSQGRTPARFARETADGRGVFELRLAHSLAFESRLQQAWASRGRLQTGGVLVFTALSKRPETFHANLTFVQGHLSFQPEIGNARQLGILQGRLGDLAADELVLGYVALPEAMDVTRPMDVYWNDRRIEVRF